ncbi:unnamed protein product [Auanema sp. JU1783]|nr:unnamed protein product [Auanema sp. JU1783]
MSSHSFSPCETPEPILEFDARPETVSPTPTFRRHYSTTVFSGKRMLYRIHPELGRLCWLLEDVGKQSNVLLMYGSGRGKPLLEQLKEFQLSCHKAAFVHNEDNLTTELDMWDLPTDVPELRAMAEREQSRISSLLEEELKELDERTAHVREVLEDLNREDLAVRSKILVDQA